MNIVGKYWLPW